MTYPEIGRRIKERRKELGISAVVLAERLSISKATIHRYESGEIKNIKLPIAESIARELRVNPLWLLGKSDRRELEALDEPDLATRLEELIEYTKRCNFALEQRHMITTGLKLTLNYIQSTK